MAVGDIIRPYASVSQPVAIPNKLGVSKAAKQALIAYLKAAVFRTDGGEDLDNTFQLEEVSDEWYGADRVIKYPSASVIEMSPTQHDAHNFTPTAIEETWGVFDELLGINPTEPGTTCLWKEGEALCDFQVDFWVDTEPDREAIEGALPALFSPDEGRYGVMIEGPELYYSRPVRCTLDPSTVNFDNVATAGRGERRLRCSVRAECDIVSLRMATPMQTPRITIEVVDPNDQPEEV